MNCQDFLDCCSKWRYWIRPLFIIIYAIGAFILVPLFLIKSFENGFNKHDQEILIAGVFAWAAVFLSFWEIIQHVIHYTQPRLQKHVIRILWMVPIYAVDAWLGLCYPQQSVILDSIRECYEAYVIYNFMKYLLNYLNMEMDLEVSLELKPQVKHIFPLCCLPDWEMGRKFVQICKHGILQYTVVRPLTTAIAFGCKLSGVYGDGEFKGNVAFPYVLVVNNISQFIAMYCLVMFYKASLAELRPMKPFPKFFCIKAVVFFSFFQSVAIDLLVYLHYLSPSNSLVYVKDDADLSLSTRLQDFLICIEMCLASIAHQYSFSFKPYMRSSDLNQSCCSSFQQCCGSFWAMWDVSDVHGDIQEHLGIVGSTISRRIRASGTDDIARANHGYTNLESTSMNPAVPHNDYDVFFNYGTMEPSKTPTTETPKEDLI